MRSPGSNTAKFLGQSRSTSFRVTPSTASHRLPFTVEGEDAPGTAPQPSPKQTHYSTAGGKNMVLAPYLSIESSLSRAVFLGNPPAVAFQHSVCLGSPEEVYHPDFQLQSSECKPVSPASWRFTCRQVAQPRNRPLRTLPRAQEDSPNDWKPERVGSSPRLAFLLFFNLI